MIEKFRPDAVFEAESLVDSEGVGLRDNRDDVDDFAQLLHHNHVDGAQAVAGRVDEEQATVDSGILNVTVTLSGELFSEVRGVLILKHNMVSVG